MSGAGLRAPGVGPEHFGPTQPARKDVPRPFGGWSACLRESSPGLILMPLYCVPGNPNHEITVIRTETGTHSRPNLLTTISCELAAALPS